MKPWCCKCNRPVDEFVVKQKTFCFSNTYIAICHGEQEECEISEEFLFLLGLSSSRIIEFKAFDPESKLPLKEIGHEEP